MKYILCGCEYTDIENIKNLLEKHTINIETMKPRDAVELRHSNMNDIKIIIT